MLKKKLKAIIQFIANPRLILCFGIAWLITNGWSYILLSVGTLFNIGWMIALASGYLAFLWLPTTPEKILTIAIAIALLRYFFPNDEKTLGMLKGIQAKLKSFGRCSNKANQLITEYAFEYNGEASLSFVLICDLHNEPQDAFLDAIHLKNPDAVLFAGDFIHNASHYAKALDFIAKVAKDYPVFCSIGNHENQFCGNLMSYLKDAGAIPLNNEFVHFKGINIGGLTSGISYGDSVVHLPPKMDWVKAFSESGGYKILLCHHPEYYRKYLKEYSIDLIVSGHAHGGQVRVFGRGVYAPGQGLFPKYTSGLYHEKLLVSRGLVNTTRYIPRLWNKPELPYIKLINNAEGS